MLLITQMFPSPSAGASVFSILDCFAFTLSGVWTGKPLTCISVASNCAWETQTLVFIQSRLMKELFLDYLIIIYITDVIRAHIMCHVLFILLLVAFRA